MLKRIRVLFNDLGIDATSSNDLLKISFIIHPPVA